MSTELATHRYQAAVASKHTSGGDIKAAIHRLLDKIDARGRVLDFGAGHGELVGQLLKRPNIESVSAVDIIPAPAELAPDVTWYVRDLNEPFVVDETFDIVTCSEVIEHLENPRATFRTLFRLVAPGGRLLLTTPNQLSLKSLTGLLLRGNFSAFSGSWYPAHITALLKEDLERIAAETGFRAAEISYTNHGCIPRLYPRTWQSISFGLLRGRLFSDNIVLLAQRPSDPIAAGAERAG